MNKACEDSTHLELAISMGKQVIISRKADTSWEEGPHRNWTNAIESEWEPSLDLEALQDL